MANALIAALLGLLAVVAEAAEPRPIPDVDTIAQLQAVDPIRTPDGWEIRAGLRDESAHAPVLRVLYLAKFVGPGERPSRTSPRGPVVVEVRWENVSATLEQFAELYIGTQPLQDGLYVRSFTCPSRGGGTFQIQMTDGTILASRHIDPRPAELSPWMPLAELQVRDEGTRAAIRNRNIAMICPAESGTCAMVVPSSGALGFQQAITIALEGDRLSVSAPKDSPFPDGTALLARWWVDGKPVTPEQQMAAIGMRYTARATTTPGATLEAFVPREVIKPGDHVALQVLSSSEGYERYGLREFSPRCAGEKPIPTPMLSNRIEFVVTEAMMVRPPEEPREPQKAK